MSAEKASVAFASVLLVLAWVAEWPTWCWPLACGVQWSEGILRAESEFRRATDPFDELDLKKVRTWDRPAWLYGLVSCGVLEAVGKALSHAAVRRPARRRAGRHMDDLGVIQVFSFQDRLLVRADVEFEEGKVEGNRTH